ncbi:hypothetical protein C1631_022860 [Chryseobacterium phosphatilyticum]|uniref:Conjugative transposon protein TraK n=1 Tax=Chryseobacterium phosphatilyticum TaxID=475075 RepID=A0A316WMP7_9FLAO|nr:hypothetical protein [Chryseobacterium phosphatilyticum]PWN62409.1 hypothetical protein C1631_022860 [Chryseobacterium phosphatilyticum]
MNNQKLEKLKNYFQQADDSANRLRKIMLFVIVFCLLTVLLSVGSLFYFYSLATSNIYVMDKGGNIATAFKQDIEGQKEVEIDNNIRIIYNTFFTYNSGNYKTQVEKGLNLMGEKGRLLFQTYKEAGWYNNVIQNNLDISSVIDSVKINSHDKPYQFKAYGRQFIRRFNIVEVRRLWTQGDMYDVPRVMQKNPHGLEASITITDNRTIKSDSIVNRQANIQSNTNYQQDGN